jgi:hypothetical protein
LAEADKLLRRIVAVPCCGTWTFCRPAKSSNTACTIRSSPSRNTCPCKRVKRDGGEAKLWRCVYRADRRMIWSVMISVSISAAKNGDDSLEILTFRRHEFQNELQIASCLRDHSGWWTVEFWTAIYQLYLTMVVQSVFAAFCQE